MWGESEIIKSTVTEKLLFVFSAIGEHTHQGQESEYDMEYNIQYDISNVRSIIVINTVWIEIDII